MTPYIALTHSDTEGVHTLLQRVGPEGNGEFSRTCPGSYGSSLTTARVSIQPPFSSADSGVLRTQHIETMGIGLTPYIALAHSDTEGVNAGRQLFRGERNKQLLCIRIGGYGNNQTWYQGTWYTLDANDGNDLYAAKKKNDDNGTTVAYKLLGIEEPMDENTHNNFANVTVTIRVVRVDGLATIYMKTADMSEFLKVSAPSEASEDRGIEKSLYGLGVCFKVGGGINGIVDNVAIWTGTGEMPAEKTVTYVP